MPGSVFARVRPVPIRATPNGHPTCQMSSTRFEIGPARKILAATKRLLLFLVAGPCYLCYLDAWSHVGDVTCRGSAITSWMMAYPEVGLGSVSSSALDRLSGGPVSGTGASSRPSVHYEKLWAWLPYRKERRTKLPEAARPDHTPNATQKQLLNTTPSDSAWRSAREIQGTGQTFHLECWKPHSTAAVSQGP